MAQSPWKPSAERERQRAMKREAVLRVAARMFVESGYHKTSLDGIAERLGVTKPTVYHYFRSKEDILFECLNVGYGMFSEACEAGLQSRQNGRERLVAALEAYANVVITDFGICLVRLADHDLSPESLVRVRAVEAEVDRRLRRLVEDGIADGSIAPCDAKVAAFTLAGALSWFGHRAQSGRSAALLALMKQSVAIMLQRLSPRPDPHAGG